MIYTDSGYNKKSFGYWNTEIYSQMVTLIVLMKTREVTMVILVVWMIGHDKQSKKLEEPTVWAANFALDLSNHCPCGLELPPGPQTYATSFN